MKKIRMIVAVIIALSLAILCVGCTPDLQKLDNPDIRQRTEAMLDALIADDFDTAYTMVSHICSKSEFGEIFQQMQQIVGNTGHYELELRFMQNRTSVNNEGKSTATHCTYEVSSETEHIIVDITVDGNNNITGFHVTPYEKTDYYFTGTLETMADAVPAQWIFLLVNVVALGVTIFALVDCCRQKIRKKALWIILVILGFITVGCTVSASMVQMNFNLGWITTYSALIHFGSGTMVVRLMLPAGAISYLIARKTLLEKASVPTELPEENPDEEVFETETEVPTQSNE